MTESTSPISICFVCLGNICRSPTAEGIFLHILREKNKSHLFRVDSAGTGAWHIGKPADERARKVAKERGIELPSIARQVQPEDLNRFDYILAMDQKNRANLMEMATSEEQKNRIHLFRDFDPAAPENSEVPDPFHGGEDHFQDVFDMCSAAANGLMAHALERASR